MKTIYLAVLAAGSLTTALAAQQQPAAAAAPSLSVAEAALAKAVADRVPQDTGSAFPADAGQLFFWTKVSGAPAGGDTKIHHVWFHGDTQAADIELRVGGSPWRVWSQKTIPAGWTGAWHVEVRDAAGAVLKRVDFTIGP